MNIYKNKLVSRFGLMHMIATNICNWLNVLIMETEHSIAGIGGSGHALHLSTAGVNITSDHHGESSKFSKTNLCVTSAI